MCVYLFLNVYCLAPDEDHLAHIIELLGPIPSEVFCLGTHWKNFFKSVSFLCIYNFDLATHKLFRTASSFESENYPHGRWRMCSSKSKLHFLNSMQSASIFRYHWNDLKAHSFADFLIPMLKFDPSKRVTATEALQHEWVNTPIIETAADVSGRP